jgi:ParB/RepB/Spo0J family partition protein
MEGDKIVHLSPQVILADNNVRYGINKIDIEAMKLAIEENGGVLQPVEVEPLPKDEITGDLQYRLVSGYRRYRGVDELNKEKGAGLTLPAIVRKLPDAKTRLMHQLSENVDRKTLSPMDTAAAIKAMMDAGFTRLQIRETFKRPGGPKANQLQPASNAWVNMILSFMDLPKPIRDKVHSGVVGVAAAYELTKLPADRHAEVVAAAEAEIAKAVEKDEREEEKYLKGHQKLEEATKAEEATAVKLDTAAAELEIAERALALKEEEQGKAFTNLKAAEKSKDKAAKKAAKEGFDAIEADVKGLAKKVEGLKGEREKLEKAKVKVATTAAELRKKLEEARKPVAKVKKAVGSADVKKAAKETGASTEHVVPTIAEIRSTIDALSLAPQPKVASIGSSLKKYITGVTTPGILLKELLLLTSEKASPKK